MVFLLDYTCRARWPFRAFAQESLKSVTSPTSYRKYPQKGPNLGLPRMLIFWFTFISIEIKLHLVSRGTPLFSIFFYARLGILKQYCTFQGPKSGPNRWRLTDERTHERTDAHQKFEASCTKALKGNNTLRNCAPGDFLTPLPLSKISLKIRISPNPVVKI